MPFKFIDHEFDLDLKDESINGSYFLSKPTEESNNEKIKLGKVLCNHKNIGIAQIGIDKLDDLGTNAIYNISDYRILIW